MRKFILTFVLGALAALPGSAIPSFDFTIPAANLTVAPGGTATFGYEVENTSTEGETLLLSNLGFNVLFTGFGVETDLFDLVMLAPGATGSGNLFQVAVNPGAPVGPYAFVATLTVLFDDVNFTSLQQSQAVSIDVQAVPEPATLSLLGAALCGAAALLRLRHARAR
jgi:hypothetical protein